MKRMTIGVRGTGIAISSSETFRLVTAESARRYARLLDAAANEVEQQQQRAASEPDDVAQDYAFFYAEDDSLRAQLAAATARAEAAEAHVAKHIGEWIERRIAALEPGPYTETVRGALVLVQAYVTAQMPAVLAAAAAEPKP